jgi:hypothetical protein
METAPTSHGFPLFTFRNLEETICDGSERLIVPRTSYGLKELG